MSLFDLETPSENTIFWDVADINREFLTLLTDSELDLAHGALGLDGGVLSGLRGLSNPQLDALAASPVLLVEFSPLPELRAAELVPDRHRVEASAGLYMPEGAATTAWQENLRGFADRVLTCMWQAAKQRSLFSVFCMGLDPAAAEKLAAMSFADISEYSTDAHYSLHARLAEHPRCWSSLIHSMLDGDLDKRMAAQMSLIPLSIAQRLPKPRSPNRRLYG